MATWLLATLSCAAYALLCGGIGAYCSNEKGRPWLEGLFLGALLGPFGVNAASSLPDLAGTSSVDSRDRSIDLTAARDDASNPEELERWLKRSG
jgi:hypothetical protein